MEIITSHDNREYNLIEYFICDTSIGEMLFGRYRDVICFAAFTCNVGQVAVLEELRSRFPKAELRQTADKFDPTLSQPHKILLIGTKFQISVWIALLSIESGKTATYSEIAHLASYPKAIRATASAIGDNPICYTIPCHRIIPASGDVGNYHWGANIKRKLLVAEGVLPQCHI